MIGKRIAHYEVSARLGAGGMGEVYLARDTKLGREVALKLLPVEMSANENARARLLNEARTASSLNHPHICTIYEVGEAEGQTYVGMELVAGQPLSQLVPTEGLPIENVVRYGAQIAGALAYAHELGIIHRDLKTANVMITPDGRAKVLDFGLAKQLRDDQMAEATRSRVSLTQAGTIVGTLHAIAPEVLSGKAASAQSDVWALGVLLYEMAAGALPFHGKTGFELTSSILREPPAPITTRVPAGLRAIIQRCLAKEPGQRYQRASEVRAALEAIGSDTTIAAATEATRAGLRWKWIALGGAALVTMLVVWQMAKRATPPDSISAPANPSGPRLSGGGRASPIAEANEYYEKALVFLGAGAQFDLRRARQMLEKALEIDPHFAQARAEYGFTSYLMVDSGASNDSSWLYRAEEELRRALQDDPNGGRAHSALAAVYIMQGKKELAPAEVDQALKLNPKDLDAYNWLQNFHTLNGDNVAAQADCRKMLEMNPLFWPARMNLADNLREAGKPEQAIRELDKIIELDPRNYFAYIWLWRVHAQQGELARAREALARAPQTERQNYHTRIAWAIHFALEGKRAAALKEMDAEVQKYHALNPSTTELVAAFYALLKEEQKALEWLERAVRNGDERAEWFRRNPWLKNIRENPRFQQILASIAYQKQQRKK